MLAIATNIPVLLMTGFGVQGHIYNKIHELKKATPIWKNIFVKMFICKIITFSIVLLYSLSILSDLYENIYIGLSKSVGFLDILPNFR